MSKRLAAPSHSIRTIAVAPLPAAGEHLGSYLRRLAKDNGRGTVGEVLALADLRVATLTSGPETWRRLEALVGIGEERLGVLDPHIRPGRGRPGAIDGKPFPFTLVDTRRLRICPACVSEGHPVPLRFAIRAVTACVEHGLRLSEACPCGRERRAVDTTALWGCRECGADAADAPVEQADDAELATSDLFDPDRDRSHRLRVSFAADLLELSTSAIAAAIERIGRIVLLAGKDLPARVHHNNAAQYPPAATRSRTIDMDREIVAAAYGVLADWPRAYVRLLQSLLDRNTDDRPESYVLRRFGSEAGRLAMGRLIHLDGQIVEPVERERLAFLERAIGYVPYEAVRVRRKQDDAGDAPPSKNRRMAPTRRDVVTVKEIMSRLHLGGSASIDAWFDAGLLEPVELAGVRAVAKDQFEALLDRIRSFDAPGDLADFASASKLLRHLPVDYAKSAFLIDLFSGRIRTRQAENGQEGLRSLSLHRGDFGRWSMLPQLIRRMDENGHLTRRRALDLILAIWPDSSVSSGADLSAARKAGLVSTSDEQAPLITYSIRDLVRLVQQRGAERLVADQK